MYDDEPLSEEEAEERDRGVVDYADCDEYAAELEPEPEPEPEPAKEAIAKDGTPDAPDRLPFTASVYVDKGRLCTLALCETPWGTIPIASHFRVDPGVPDGPVDVGVDLHPSVDKALDESARRLTIMGQRETLKLAAENTVERARMGDQNAMAMIAMVRDGAQAGHPKARMAYSLIHAYIQARPYAPLAVRVGAESEPLRPTAYSASVRLANGPPLSRERIRSIASSFEGEDGKLLLHGVIHFRQRARLDQLGKRMGRGARRLLDTGRSLGMARSIQAVRRPNSRLSQFSPMVGWELGE